MALIHNNSTLKKINFIVSYVYFGIIFLTILLFIKYIIPFFFPFLIGFLIAYILKPIYIAMHEKTKLSLKFCGLIVVFIAYCMLGAIVWIFIIKVINIIQIAYNSRFVVYYEYILPLVTKIKNIIDGIFYNISPQIAIGTTKMLDILFSESVNMIILVAKSILMSFAKIGIIVPDFCIGLIFSVMSSIFISSGYYEIFSAVVKLIPQHRVDVFLKTKDLVMETLSKIFKSYAILMCISFIELIIGFYIIGICKPISMAFLTALCDIIPLFGSGIILLPWSIFMFGVGRIKLAIGLILIYILMGVFRSILEPKILQNQLGIHPLISLICIYSGMKLFGLMGMIVLPILVHVFLTAQIVNFKENG